MRQGEGIEGEEEESGVQRNGDEDTVIQIEQRREQQRKKERDWESRKRSGIRNKGTRKNGMREQERTLGSE